MSERPYWPDMGAEKVDQHGRRYFHAMVDKGATISRHLERWQIRTIHPYDLTEYHYAVSVDCEHWNINRLVGREVRSIARLETDNPHVVVKYLRGLDADLAPNIDKS